MQTPIELHIATAADLPRLFEIRNAPESTQMAGIKAQTWERFVSVWARTDVVSRAIVEGDEIVGSISIFERDGVWEMGYIIDRARWGCGIATQAVALMLQLVEQRPIYAIVSDTNAGSRRVLDKVGMTVDRRRDDGVWVYVAR